MMTSVFPRLAHLECWSPGSEATVQARIWTYPSVP